MADSSVDSKVREALTAANGSRAVAQKMLIAMAVKDPQLLLAMAQPFLQAIAAAAIERVLRRGRSAPQAGRSGAGSGALSREALAQVLDRMGRDDDEPSAGKPGTPARPAAATPAAKAAPPGASHEKSMLAIAKAFAAKKVR